MTIRIRAGAPRKRIEAGANASVITIYFPELPLIKIEKPLVLNRALVVSPRVPWQFLLSVPQNANNRAGGAEGGYKGGIPPRPPLRPCLSPFVPEKTFLLKLRGVLLKVRTFFVDNHGL